MVPFDPDRADVAQLAAKVAFLSDPASYRQGVRRIETRETHMSWVFLAGQHVFKLKKPACLSFLDYSTLARRESACRAEFALNRRLAPDIYLGVEPLTKTEDGRLAIGGSGQVIDWLVVTRRVDESFMLDQLALSGRLTPPDVDRLAARLAQFCRTARRALRTPERHVQHWRRRLADNRAVLADDRFALNQTVVRDVDRAQRRFLAEAGSLLKERVRSGHIVDGHGDLRPEHIWLGQPLAIIDCLEFNADLRALDSQDELAYLAVECERLGATWVGERLRRRFSLALGDTPPEPLIDFYRCHRATLRARLSIAHLADANPSKPEKWPNLAAHYLQVAAADAWRIERAL